MPRPPATPTLPDLDLPEFILQLRPHLPDAPIPETTLPALHHHYRELRTWAPRLALIGPGTLDEVLQRHFAESLAPLPLVPETPPASGNLLDVGSGAGFPGLVLAAARPRWRVTLVEARQKKWAFLMAVCRKARLSCRCLNARVGDPLPEGVPDELDLLTARAIRLPAEDLDPLLLRLSAPGRALFWAGETDPELPRGYRATTVLRLPGTERRRIVEVNRADGNRGDLNRSDLNRGGS